MGLSPPSQDAKRALFLKAPDQLAESVAELAPLRVLQRTVGASYVKREHFADYVPISNLYGETNKHIPVEEMMLAHMSSASHKVPIGDIHGHKVDNLTWSVTSGMCREWSARKLWYAAMDTVSLVDTNVLDVLHRLVPVKEKEVAHAISNFFIQRDMSNHECRRDCLKFASWISRKLPFIELNPQVLAKAAGAGDQTLVETLCAHPRVSCDSAAFIEAIKTANSSVLRCLLKHQSSDVDEQVVDYFIKSKDPVIWAAMVEFVGFMTWFPKH